uniref:Homing endonuclease LAGLIDADG domain-containing protein n=1 Tax=Romanomermis culicivorax TaxID=13658 RepID=A0A915HWD2_ROMCU
MTRSWMGCRRPKKSTLHGPLRSRTAVKPLKQKKRFPNDQCYNVYPDKLGIRIFLAILGAESAKLITKMSTPFDYFYLPRTRANFLRMEKAIVNILNFFPRYTPYTIK